MMDPLSNEALIAWLRSAATLSAAGSDSARNLALAADRIEAALAVIQRIAHEPEPEPDAPEPPASNRLADEPHYPFGYRPPLPPAPPGFERPGEDDEKPWVAVATFSDGSSWSSRPMTHAAAEQCANDLSRQDRVYGTEVRPATAEDY